MIATSTIVMFVLMYLNTYALDHILFSEPRAYIPLAMGLTMAVFMLGFMLKMYDNRKANNAPENNGSNVSDPERRRLQN